MFTSLSPSQILKALLLGSICSLVFSANSFAAGVDLQVSTPQEGRLINQPVTFLATPRDFKAGEPLTYTFNLDTPVFQSSDGTCETNTGPANTATKTFTEKGVYLVEVCVAGVDDMGMPVTAQSSVNFTVGDPSIGSGGNTGSGGSGSGGGSNDPAPWLRITPSTLAVTKGGRARFSTTCDDRTCKASTLKLEAVLGSKKLLLGQKTNYEFGGSQLVIFSKVSKKNLKQLKKAKRFKLVATANGLDRNNVTRVETQTVTTKLAAK